MSHGKSKKAIFAVLIYMTATHPGLRAVPTNETIDDVIDKRSQPRIHSISLLRNNFCKRNSDKQNGLENH
jgi:hypothetical protein